MSLKIALSPIYDKSLNVPEDTRTNKLDISIVISRKGCTGRKQMVFSENMVIRNWLYLVWDSKQKLLRRKPT